MNHIVPFPSGGSRPSKGPSQIAFDRQELSAILKRASEHALYRIEKVPALRKKQGQFAVIAPGGLVLKRGHDLHTVLKVFDKARFRSV